MIFAQNVAKLQSETGLSNRGLASYLGISDHTVRRILNARRLNNTQYTPAYRTVRTVANRLKLTTDEVFRYRVEFHEV